ncbi:homeobox protein onecut [Caerostris darwini]|uniref:Homeobox protein onecut n=1 Tax=Caerostris darwini TaxID=1538125 RepID=A0AAV4NJD7_9ARAC|nr:homeobox protein onecut [Caerostris darwini]
MALWERQSQLNGRIFLCVCKYVVAKPDHSVMPRHLWHQPTEPTCKRKEEQQQQQQKNPNTPKKPRLVFTDLQRRTLQAIFKETKRPSKEMQITISQQLGLELSTVGNFFMNARRRSQDKWQDTEDKAKSSHLLNGHHHHLLHLSPTTTT